VARDRLEPQHQAIVDEAWVIDPIVIDQHDLRDRAEFHQLRPVAIVRGEARRFERLHSTSRILQGIEQLSAGADCWKVEFASNDGFAS
jgi:hypothetical protein